MRIFNEQCNNMKKILLSLLIMVVSLPIFAQYAPGDTVTYKLSNSLPIESVTWMYNDTAFTPVKIDAAFYMQQPIYKSGYIWYQYQVTPVTKTETIVKDTLAYIHIYNKPSFTVKLNKDTVYGDEPAIAYFTYKDTLDIDNPVDSTILSLNPGLNTISFVKGNKFAKDTVTINVRMIPVLKIDKIGYYTILQDKTETYNYVNSTSQEVNTLANRPLTLLIVSVMLVMVIILFEQGVRKIPVQYAKRVVGRKMYGGQSTHIPMKVNQAGVIPILFSLSLLQFPLIVTYFAPKSAYADFVNKYISPSGDPGLWIYVVLNVVLTMFFTYFYTAITFNPTEVAENMRQSGGFVPGIRPGTATVEYLSRVMSRLCFSGGLFLAAVSVIPTIVSNFTPFEMTFGGTSLLIAVGVATDTVKQIQNQMLMRNYQGFLK